MKTRALVLKVVQTPASWSCYQFKTLDELAIEPVAKGDGD